MNYRIIEHTADFGIHVFGNNLNRLFGNAAHALFDLITDVDVLEEKEKINMRVSGSDWPDLMVNWLRELLCLWTVEDRLVKNIDIQRLTEYSLRAVATCDRYEPSRHSIKEEIKAVTYHQINVYQGESGWEAKVIFDV